MVDALSILEELSGRLHQEGALVWDLVLDGADGAVVVLQFPLLALLLQDVEERALQVNERLLNDGNYLGLSFFQPHHRDKREASRQPLVWLFLQVLDGADQPGEAPVYQSRGIKAQTVAVVCVELRRERAPTLVALAQVQSQVSEIK